MNIKERIEDCINNNPLPLLAIQEPLLREVIDLYLPYSVGIEWEVNKKEDYDEAIFKSIPNIMNVNVDDSEQRYRIPNGLNGLICLYEICKNLRKYSILNLGSVIHYHIDMGDSISLINKDLIDKHKEWVLTELDTWQSTFTREKRNVTYDSKFNWLNFRPSFKTAEFRIGEMSFDYEVIVQRVLHCNRIIKRFREGILSTKKLDRLLYQLEELEVEEKIVNAVDRDTAKKIINQRIIKVKRHE